MLEQIEVVLPKVLSWFGSVLNSILQDTGQLVELRDLILIGFCVSIVFLVSNLISKFTWGN